MSAQTELSAQAKQSLAYSYAVLALTDAKKDISVENIEALVKKSGVAVNANLGKVFEKALKGKNPEDFFACGGGAAPAAGGAAPAAGGAAAEEPKKDEPEEEEEDMDMGGLFD